MLPTDVTNIIHVFLLAVGLLAAVWAAISWRRADQAYKYCEQVHEWVAYEQEHSSTNSKTTAMIAKMNLDLTNQDDILHQLADGLKKLRSRTGMRELRDKRSVNGGDIPDPQTDPDGWKRYMRKELKLGAYRGK